MFMVVEPNVIKLFSVKNELVQDGEIRASINFDESRQTLEEHLVTFDQMVADNRNSSENVNKL